MKKWYRVGICLVLVVCLLLLSACQGNPNPLASDPTLSLGNESTDTTDHAENNPQMNEANDPTQGNRTQANKADDPTQGNRTQANKADDPTQGNNTLTNKTDDPTKENNSQSDAIKLNFKEVYIKLREWNSGSLFKGTQLNYETCQADGFTKNYGISYKQEYFSDRSLILVELTPLSEQKVWKVTDVSYENGVVVCRITEICQGGDRVVNWGYSAIPPVPDFWACFIEIDSVIPDGTEVKVEFDDITVDYEEYKQKYSEFRDKAKYM